MSRTLFIFGSGAQGRVIRDILITQYPGVQLYFVDENPALQGSLINHTKVIGLEEMKQLAAEPQVHIAIGNPNTREMLAGKLRTMGALFVSAIHPSAVVAPTAIVGDGCMVAAGAIINTNAMIGSCCIINTGAVIEHDTVMDDYSCVSPRATIGGRVHIGAKAFIASAAVVLARTVIGQQAVVGMGAVVTRDVAANAVVYGVPAVVKGRTDETFNWSKLF